MIDEAKLIAQYREKGFDWVSDAQKIVRCLMEGFAFPGKIIQMPELFLSSPEPKMKYVMGPLLTLLDQQVSFCVRSPDPEEAEATGQYIQVNTGSVEKSLEEANYVLFLGPSEGKIKQVNQGELEAPHKGATVFYLVKALSEGAASGENAWISLKISGPGIKGIRDVAFEGVEPSEVDSWIEIRREYPLGIDIFLVSLEGHLCGLPRSTKIARGG